MNEDERLDLYQRVKALMTQGRTDEATGVCMDLLDNDANDPSALYQLGTIMLKERRRGLAYNLFARGVKYADDVPELWSNYAQAHKDSPEEWGRTEWCLRKAIKLFEKQNKPSAVPWANLGMLYYIKGELVKAQDANNKALAEDSTNKAALATQGFIHLANGAWSKAWSFYDVLLDAGVRVSTAYGDEPTWDGAPGKSIIVSGEQGLGDEIMYASVFQEAIDDSEHVVIECMPRLEKLFQRSFPKAKVYGQRYGEEVFWDEDHKIDAHIPMATLPRFYRNKEEEFSGKPYLVPNPDMATAFREMLKAMSGKPKIGIAWTGGTQRTRGYLRDRSLEELVPVLREPNVDWVSLEYHDRSDEIREFKDKRGIEIHQFPWITGKGLDYDLTAALVSELDLVISVPTTVTQMAGAVGVDCWVLVPRYTGWIFARDVYPWANSVTPLRNTSTPEVAEKLKQWHSTRIQTSKQLSPTG